MKSIRIICVSLLILTAVNAMIAGALFMIDSTGQKMGMHVSYFQYSPFRSFLIPGIILFVANGLLNFFAAYALIKNKLYAPVLIICQGAILCGWIVIQVLMVRDITALHVIMLTIGLILALCGFLLKNKMKQK